METPERTTRCPACGEDILAVATKCKHCGKDFAEEKRQKDAARIVAKVFVAIGIGLVMWGSIRLGQVSAAENAAVARAERLSQSSTQWQDVIERTGANMNLVLGREQWAEDRKTAWWLVLIGWIVFVFGVLVLSGRFPGTPLYQAGGSHGAYN